MIPGKVRYILHADLDAFYASVEQLDAPQLRGKPVIVGGRPESRGVVAACSYEARALGIHSAMPMRTAVNRCPSAVIVSPRFDRYREVSAMVMDIFRSVTDLVEPLSLDEAYLDITHVVTQGSAPVEVARRIRQRVRAEVGLTVSVGVASSKCVAKIASDLRKPDGLLVVAPGTEAEFLAPLPVRRLWGIGPRTERRLMERGIETLGAVAAQSDDWLRREFGKRWPEIKSWCLGRDDRPVSTVRAVKSVSAEVTFARDTSDPVFLKDEVARLSARVAQRMATAGVKGRTVVLKLRLSDFTTLTRRTTLAGAITEAGPLSEVAQRMLVNALAPGRSFRLIGVGVSNFRDTLQLRLFDW